MTIITHNDFTAANAADAQRRRDAARQTRSQLVSDLHSARSELAHNAEIDCASKRDEVDGECADIETAADEIVALSARLVAVIGRLDHTEWKPRDGYTRKAPVTAAHLAELIAENFGDGNLSADGISVLNAALALALHREG